MWAVEHWGIEPDILLSAKGIASGMPLSAMVAKASLMESWGKGAHGSTYGGNPVSCAAALATLELLQGGLIANAAERGAQGLAALRGMHQRFEDVVEASRGLGLMLALKLATPEMADALQWEAFRRGVLVLGAGRSAVRVSPPLVIDQATMASGLAVLEEAVAAVAEMAAAGTLRPASDH
jgi:4-aminobutyrate aminotransferase